MISRLGTALVAVAAILVAPPAAEAGPDEDAQAAVARFSPASPDSYIALTDALAAGRASIAALAPDLASADPERRWAAAYVAQGLLLRTSAERRPLERLLGGADTSVRALAAFGLLGSGSKNAFPALLALLSDHSPMRNGEVLEPLSVLAEERLAESTGRRFGNFADARSRPSIARSWRRWHRRNRARLRWDARKQRYVARGRARRSALRARSPAAAGRGPSARASATDFVLPVHYHLRFQDGIGASERRAVLANIASALRVLNGPEGRTGGCSDLEFRITTTAEGATPPGAVEVKVVREGRNPFGYGTSFISGDDEHGAFTLEQATGPRGADVIAHETMHVLGLPDEYYKPGPGQAAIAIDPTSLMSSAPNSGFQQRHFDELVRLRNGIDGACSRWRLGFTPWHAEQRPYFTGGGLSQTNVFGVGAEADIEAEFWVDFEAERILPAGQRPCGRDTLAGRRADRPSGFTAPCPEAGGNSVGVQIVAAPGEARCSRAEGRFRRQRFDTVVSGRTDGRRELRLTVKAGDVEEFRFVCDPAAEPVEASFSLIANSMEWAGAAGFRVPLPDGGGAPAPVSFEKSDEHRGANGTAVITPLD